MSQQTVMIITILVYLGVMLLLGLLNAKGSGTLEGFTVGKRNAGAWLTALSYGTAYFSAVMFVGYSGNTGWNFGLWAVLVGIGNAIFGSFFAWKILASPTRKASRAFDIRSMPQLFETRYQSKGMKSFAAMLVFIFLLPYSASVYKGLTSVCSILLGIDETVCMILIAVASALLLVAGGYLATIKADFVQGLVMLVGVALLIVFVLVSPPVLEGGSIAGLWEKMGAEGLQTLDAKRWISLIATVLMTSFGTWGLPQMVHKYYAIKDETEIRRGTVISTLFALLVAGGGYFIGSLSRLFFVSPEAMTAAGGVDSIIPNLLVASKLPVVLMGVVLMLLISASVSTLSAVTMSACSTCTMDLIQPALKKQPKDKTMSLLTKGLCLVFVAGSYFVANTNTPILDMMSYSWGILSGSFLAPYLLALYHKGMTKTAAWAGMLTGFVVAFCPALCKLISLAAPKLTGFVPEIAAMGPQFAVAAMLLSFGACLLVARLQKGKNPDTNPEFYAKAEL